MTYFVFIDGLMCRLKTVFTLLDKKTIKLLLFEFPLSRNSCLLSYTATGSEAVRVEIMWNINTTLLYVSPRLSHLCVSVVSALAEGWADRNVPFPVISHKDEFHVPDDQC